MTKKTSAEQAQERRQRLRRAAGPPAAAGRRGEPAARGPAPRSAVARLLVEEVERDVVVGRVHA